MLKPLKRETAYRDVRLALTDSEWGTIKADANEVGVSPDQLLSCVVAYATRARILHASTLALADILPWSRLPYEPPPEEVS